MAYIPSIVIALYMLRCFVVITRSNHQIDYEKLDKATFNRLNFIGSFGVALSLVLNQNIFAMTLFLLMIASIILTEVLAIEPPHERRYDHIISIITKLLILLMPLYPIYKTITFFQELFK